MIAMVDGPPPGKPVSARRHLLLVRAGDESLHRNWIDQREPRNFDLLVSYYGAVAGRFAHDGEFYHAEPGPPWTGYHAALEANPALRDAYDYFGFADNDLDADTATWNALFDACETYRFDLAQPAILGPISHAITKPVPFLKYRLTTFVENMCPVFSKRALAICYGSFNDTVSGWGLNHIWPRLLAPHGGRLAVIDSVRVRHTQALQQGTLYELLKELGVNPGIERDEVMARNGIAKADIRELSRVRMTLREAIRRVAQKGWKAWG